MNPKRRAGPREELILTLVADVALKRKSRRITLQIVRRKDTLVERLHEKGQPLIETDLIDSGRGGTWSPLPSTRLSAGLSQSVLRGLRKDIKGPSFPELRVQCAISVPNAIAPEFRFGAASQLPVLASFIIGPKLRVGCLAHFETGAVFAVLPLSLSLSAGTAILAASTLAGILKLVALAILGFMIKSALGLAVIPWGQVVLLLLLVIGVVLAIISEIAKALGGTPSAPGSPAPPAGTPAWYLWRAQELQRRADALKQAVDATMDASGEPSGQQMTDALELANDAKAALDSFSEMADGTGHDETLDEAKAEYEKILEDTEQLRNH